MNIIEQLGGYNKVKEIINKAPCNTYTYHNHPYQKGYIRCWGSDGEEYFVVSDIEQALLQYRRENNIFEVGDKVVYVDDFMPDTIGTVSNIDDRIWLNDDNAVCIKEMIRHVDLKEIQSGCRL